MRSTVKMRKTTRAIAMMTRGPVNDSSLVRMAPSPSGSTSQAWTASTQR